MVAACGPLAGSGKFDFERIACLQGMDACRNHEPARRNGRPGICRLPLQEQDGAVCLVIEKIDRLVTLVFDGNANRASWLIACRSNL